MRKLLAIVRREYRARVRTKAFLITTLLLPLFVVGSAVAPQLLFAHKSGGATRLAVVDETGRLYAPLREALQTAKDEDEAEQTGQPSAQMPGRGMPDANNEEQMRQIGKAMGQRFEIEQVQTSGRSIEEIRRDLNARVQGNQLDAYVVLPPNILAAEGKAEYRARNLGDVITTSQVKHALRRAVIEERMRGAHIDPLRVRELSKEIQMDAFAAGAGAGKDTGGSFGLAMGVGLFTYMIILLYGQMLLSSVVEEKTTRISEVLFSSVKPFQLMAGKLIGVSLAGLTQLAIWLLALLVFTTFGVAQLAARGVNFAMPHVPALFFACAVVYFLVGFLMYGTLYVLVGSMVTSEREGGQMAMPIIFLSVVSIYMTFPVIRSPNSPLAFWVSIAPFFSPVTMLVRIVTETPPLWQIALSLSVGIATIILLTWVAARIYRIGMLMYGKTASIPEVMRWLRQS